METMLTDVNAMIHPNSNVSLLVEWFLNKENMSHKKIQKLCYYAEAWSLTLLDTDIVPEIEFEAWVHGPVNREIYDRCRRFGWRDIMVDPEVKEKSQKEVEENFSNQQKEILELVWRTYGGYDADQLENLSHSEDPWQEARAGLGKFENCSKKISKDTIKKYYSSQYEEF